MQGTVIFYRLQEGYGFILGQDNKRYYFNVHELIDLVRQNDIVEFTTRKAPTLKLNPVAYDIKIIKHINSEMSHDINNKNNYPRKTLIKYEKQTLATKTRCPHCSYYMVPYIIYNKEGLKRSICPFCGKTYKIFSPCFIASAIYESNQAHQVIALRRFRDDFLQPYILGRMFIKIYYFVSPYIAVFLIKHKIISKLLKPTLSFLAYISE